MASETTQALLKALEAGGYDSKPSSLNQGSALQIEDLSPVMHNLTWDDQHIKLQKMLKNEPCKSTLAQFNRQLSYGGFGGSAGAEGAVGQEETSDIVRVTVPMAYYSHIRKVTLVANLVDTFDGTKAEDRAASDAGKKIVGDIEFDCFRGMADFSNAGVFDGEVSVLADLPNMRGADMQIRGSDSERSAKDLMFAEYGSDDTVVIAGGGTLTQDMIEDASVRSALNMGNADKLVVDPKVLSAYNKIAFGKERIVLAGSAQDATGAELRKQWVSNGVVDIEASQFLRGKAKPAPAKPNGPGAPSLALAAQAGATSSAAGAYVYYVTAFNELGESVASASVSVTLTAGQQTQLTITPSGSGSVARGFNMYRSAVGGTAATAKFIGRVRNSGGATTVILDLFNKKPGFVTGFLLQKDTMAMKELSPYGRLKLAVTSLALPEAHFRFCSLAVMEPRKNVLIDNLVGSF